MPARSRACRVEQALLQRSAEGRAVVVALPDVDVPHVRMRVEENEAERPVHRRVRAELAEHDEMVAAQAEGPGTGPDDRLEMLCYLGDRPLRVAGRHGDVSEIGYREASEDLRAPAPGCTVAGRSRLSGSPLARTGRPGDSSSPCRTGYRAPRRRRPRGSRRAGSARRSSRPHTAESEARREARSGERPLSAPRDGTSGRFRLASAAQPRPSRPVPGGHVRGSDPGTCPVDGLALTCC